MSAVVVLYTEANFIGGAESVLMQIVAGLAGDLRPVVVGPVAEVVHAVADAGRDIERHVTPRIRGRFDLEGMRTLRRTLRSIGPAVVHVNLTDMGDCLNAIATMSTMRDVRIVVLEHNAFPLYSRAQRVAKIASVRAIDAHVAVSAWLASIVAKASMERPSRLRVVPNGVSPAEPHDLIERSPVRFGVVSRLDPQKGVDLVLRAIAEVPDATLSIAGEGDEREALEALVRELDISSRVEFHGWLDSEDCYDDIDVYVLASYNEALSMSVLEAMQRGLPVVATDVGGLREAITDDVTGFVVPPGDVAALAGAMRRLAAEPALRRSFGAAGLARARRDFTASAMVDAYATLYRQLATSRRRAWN